MKWLPFLVNGCFVKGGGVQEFTSVRSVLVERLLSTFPGTSLKQLDKGRFQAGLNFLGNRSLDTYIRDGFLKSPLIRQTDFNSSYVTSRY